MGKHIRYYKKFYEWCDEDLWGHVALSSKNSKLLAYLYKSFQANSQKRALAKRKIYKSTRKRFKKKYKQKFLYEIYTKEKEFQKKKRRFRSKEYFTLFKLRVFYGNLKATSFRPLLNTKARNQNIWAGSTPFLLESRLDILLYRTNLFKSIFFVKQFIRHKGVLVNGLCLNQTNAQVNIGDIVSIPFNLYHEFYNFFFKRLQSNKVLTNYPGYVEMNYKIGSLTLLRLPRGGEIAYPFKVSAKLHWFMK